MAYLTQERGQVARPTGGLEIYKWAGSVEGAVARPTGGLENYKKT